MKMREIISAVMPMKKLMGLDIKVSDAYKLAKLANALEEELKIYQKLEYDAREWHKDQPKELEKELLSILDLDVDKEIKSIAIKMPDGKLSAQDILALTQFVEFEEDEE